MNALLGCQEWHISTSTTGGGEGDGSSVRNDQSIKTGLQLDAWQEVSAQLEAVADGEAELSFAKFPENVSANQLQIQLPDDYSRRAISSTQAIRTDETLVLTGFADRSSRRIAEQSCRGRVRAVSVGRRSAAGRTARSRCCW